jgi:hypothetical protein
VDTAGVTEWSDGEEARVAFRTLSSQGGVLLLLVRQFEGDMGGVSVKGDDAVAVVFTFKVQMAEMVALVPLSSKDDDDEVF